MRALWHALDTYNPFMASVLDRILEAEKPDVVNTHNITGFSVSSFSAVTARGMPIVHTLHDQYFVCANSMMYRSGDNCASQCMKCKILTAARRRASQNASLVIGVSQFILDRHQEFGAFENVDKRVIYNSVIVPESGNCAVRARDSKKFTFGYLGRIHPSKGLHDLVRAFSREQLGDSQLWIAGSGDSAYVESLKVETACDANVVWLGHVAATTFLQELDVLVVPSRWNDTAPLVVQEAFAHGVPVIGANRGGIAELIAPGIGWIYEPGRPEQLQRTLRLSYDARDSLHLIAKEARKYAAKFSPQQTLEEYLGAYAAVV